MIIMNNNGEAIIAFSLQLCLKENVRVGQVEL